MLTATYSLVALTAEQKSTRSILAKLHMQIQDGLHDLKNINRSYLENALAKLEQFEQYCHTRKFELYVIPALRKRTNKADPILEELESLKSRSIELLSSLQHKLRNTFSQGMVEVSHVCAEMELYCRNLVKRLAKEEEELLPMLRNLLPIEEWFDIAAKFLSEDEKKKYQKSLLIQNAQKLSAT